MSTIGAREDAGRRCLRTAFQGAVAAALVAAAGAVTATVVPGETIDTAVLAATAATAALTAGAAYVQRRVEAVVEYRRTRQEEEL